MGGEKFNRKEFCAGMTVFQLVILWLLLSMEFVFSWDKTC